MKFIPLKEGKKYLNHLKEIKSKVIHGLHPRLNFDVIIHNKYIILS